MTTRREYEREVWSFLGAHLQGAGGWGEIGLDDSLDDASQAEQDRANAAVERVVQRCYRHAGKGSQ